MAEYLDLNSIDNPTTGSPAPASWGDQTRENLERLAKPYMVRVRRTTPQSIPTAAGTAVAWDTQDYDENNGTTEMWLPGAPANLVLPITGRYEAKFGAQFAINAAGLRLLYIAVNGVVKGILHDVGNASWYVGGVVSAEFAGLAGQAVSCFAYQNSGGDLNLDMAYETWATCRLVSR